jgi:2',3'-cyclic-nucleotide 2'-phosphodiesterase (5'-nucleotidase family)
MKVRVVLALGSLMFAAAAGYSAGQEETVRVLYSASLNGNIDGCDCLTRPKAGLVKRAAFIKALPSLESSVLLDCGDVSATRVDPALSKALLDTYRELAYDAVAVGDQELINGVSPFFSSLDAFPFVSDNLTVCDSDQVCRRVSAGPLMLTRGKARVAVISLIDPDVFARYQQSVTKCLKVVPPTVAAGPLIRDARDSGADLLILLYHGPVEAAEALVADNPGIDLLVVGHEQQLIDGKRLGGTVEVSPGGDGNWIGSATFVKVGDAWRFSSNSLRMFAFNRDPDDPVVRKRIEEYYSKP